MVGKLGGYDGLAILIALPSFLDTLRDLKYYSPYDVITTLCRTRDLPHCIYTEPTVHKRGSEGTYGLHTWLPYQTLHPIYPQYQQCVSYQVTNDGLQGINSCIHR